MKLPEEIIYLLKIDRRSPWPRPYWRTFLPLDRAELYVLEKQSIEPAKPSQIPDFKDHLVQIYEGDLACMGLGLDPFEWDCCDRRFLRMVFAAICDNSKFDIRTIKIRLALPEDHSTWDEAH